MRFFSIFSRCVRLRCPICGKGRLYASLIRMNSECSQCGYSFDRESGFYLGAIYFNYGLTALIVSITYPVLVFTGSAKPQVALAICMSFAVLFPLFFFRYARSLWLGFDEFIDPHASQSNDDA